MKTNEQCTPNPSGLHAATGFPHPGMRLIVIAVLSILSLAIAPVARAGSPDGSYEFISATGSVTFAGETTRLGADEIAELGIANDATLQVKKKKVNLNRNAVAKLLKKLEKQFGAEVETTVTGPRTVKLRKTKKGWTGKTTRPVVVKFTVSYGGETFKGTLRSHFKVKVVGKKLTMTVPITGNLAGAKFKAKAVTKFKR